MHRNNLKSLLENYSPKGHAEHDYKQRMLEFLAICPDCFDRSCAIGHFTASAWIINPAADKCLLMHHTKLDQWLQLGGHCDGDSDLLNVAIKEAQEESGITAIEPVSQEIFDIDIHLIPPHKQVAAHYHFDVRFLLQVKSNAQISHNEEAQDLQWFDFESTSLPTTQYSILRMLQKYNDLKISI